MVDIGPGGSASTPPIPVGSYQQFDLSGGMDFGRSSASRWLGKAELKVGVDNVFNRMPPEAPNAFPSTNADIGDYNGPHRAPLLRRGKVPLLSDSLKPGRPGAD